MSVLVEDRSDLSVLICEKSQLYWELLSRGIQSLDSRVRLSRAQSVEQATAQLTSEPVSVILVSSLETAITRDVFRLMRMLRESFPQIPMVYLADSCTEDAVVDGFHAGARGVAYRNESFAELFKCVEQVSRNGVWAGPREIQFIIAAFANSVVFQTQNAIGDELLTCREKQVAHLVAEGMSNREISMSLKISEHTVKNYMFHIFEKLGISNRVELVRYTQSRWGEAA